MPAAAAFRRRARSAFCLLVVAAALHLLLSDIWRTHIYHIELVADNDHKSRQPDGSFASVMAQLLLILRPARSSSSGTKKLQAHWIAERAFRLLPDTSLARQAQGFTRYMELSALTEFAGMLLTCDDRTGHVLRVDRDTGRVHLWTDLGRHVPQFKCEWLTVRGGELYAGSFGKPFVHPETSELIHKKFLNVCRVTKEKVVTVVDWERQYDAMKKALNVADEGFVIHEAIEWLPKVQKWIVVPRKESNLTYTEDIDFAASSSSLLICNADFTSIQTVHLGPTVPSAGFSDVAYSISTSATSGKDVYWLFATRTKEDSAGNTRSSLCTIMCTDLDQARAQCQMLDETEISTNNKFEGIVVRPVHSRWQKTLYYFYDLYVQYFK